MNIVKPLLRTVAFAGLLASALIATPSQAAQADIDLLKGYVGEWRGRGVLAGETGEPETLVCRLSLREGNQDKVNYSGRCSLAGVTMAMNGTVAFINNRYEAVMSSNVRFTGVAVGQRQGESIVFNLQQKGEANDGRTGTVTASLVLANGAINVDFRVVEDKTGEITTARVPFSR